MSPPVDGAPSFRLPVCAALAATGCWTAAAAVELADLESLALSLVYLPLAGSGSAWVLVAVFSTLRRLGRR
ncbi:MAG: hypothetical protein KF878_33430 [Planctomycetes bacterium]|nr:hypothetical protein [Planctomycetota bacterium]